VPRLADTVLDRRRVRSTLYDDIDGATRTALPQAGRAETAWRQADVFE